MAGTTVVAAVDQLVALVQAHEAAPADSVFYSPQGPDVSGVSYICVGDWVPADVEDPSLRTGRRRRDEKYDLEVVCESYVQGGEQRDADVAACELVRAVDETVADYPVLTGISLDTDQQIIKASVTGWRIDGRGPVGHEGHGCRFIVTVRVHARLL